MEQRQEDGVRALQIKIPRKVNNGLSDQYKQNDYDTIESQDSQFHGVANLDEIEDLNID